MKEDIMICGARKKKAAKLHASVTTLNTTERMILIQFKL